MIEAPAPVPVAEEAPVEKEGKEEGEEIFKIHQPEFVSKINVIGQIDLAALNQSTRPKKKSKEEKRKEREEKEKIRQDQKKQMKEAIIKEIRRDDSKLKDTAAGDANGKKKRVRINKEKGGHQQCFQLPAWWQRTVDTLGAQARSGCPPARWKPAWWKQCQ